MNIRILLPAIFLIATSSPFQAADLNAADTDSGQTVNGEAGDAADLSVFYDALKPLGTWYTTTQYAVVWHPKVADQKDWRPYSIGSWAQTDQGWTWVSDESFGWAVYHYGRWIQLEGCGWAWVPGSKWAPAWVAWRSVPGLQMADVSAPPSDNDATAAAPAPPASDPPASATSVSIKYVGWAPLPPEADLPPDGQLGPSVDADYSIPPENYSFVDAAELGAPDVEVVIYPRERNYFYVERTVNVTRIAYYGPGGRLIYVAGPDFARIRASARQPVSTMTLERETDAGLVAKSLREGNTSSVEGNTLRMVGPRLKDRPAGGIVPSDHATLPKTGSAKAAPPPGADPAAVARAQDAIRRQSGETFSHAQAARAIAASQAEYKTARENPANSFVAGHASLPEGGGKPLDEPRAMEEARASSHAAEEQHISSRGKEDRSASTRGAEKRSTASHGADDSSSGSRAEGSGRHHTAEHARGGSGASPVAGAQQPQSFGDQLAEQFAEAGRQLKQAAMGQTPTQEQGAKGQTAGTGQRGTRQLGGATTAPVTRTVVEAPAETTSKKK